MNAKMNRLLCGAAIVAGAEIFLIAAPAFAQIDEIIVTARKREESLQDVPIAVSAFDEAAIEKAHANVISEFDKFTPNVEFADNNFAGQALNASIRGISFADLEKTFEPTVGFSIDGVFLANNTGAAIDVFDIEQVEILRGPQGTLYGRNTTGGVINITRSRPTGEFGLKARARLGSFNEEQFSAVLNLPEFEDALSLKLHLFKNKEDTFAKNIRTGERERAADSISGGFALLFEPHDRVENLTSFEYIDDDSGQQPIVNLTVPVNDPTTFLPNFFISGVGNFCDATLDGAAIGLISPGTANEGCVTGESSVFLDSDGEFFAQDVQSLNSIEGFSITNNFKYDLNENLTLTSITGYREHDERLITESAGSTNLEFNVSPDPAAPFFVPVPLFVADRVQNSNQFSQELRIDGRLNDRTDFVSGLYYLRSEFDLTGGDFAGTPATAIVFGGPAANNSTAQTIDAFAAFFDFTYALTERLSFSGGGRWTFEEKEFSANLDPLTGAPAENFTVSEKFDSPTWRAILQYDINDDANGYISYSRGFRSGGFNGRPTSQAFVGPYDSETVDTFEVGLRTEFLGNTLRFNPTAFYTNYKDLQVEYFTLPPGGSTIPALTIQNATDVDIWGLELESLYQPTDELSFRVAAGYLDHSIGDFITPDFNLVSTNSPLFDPAVLADFQADPSSLPTTNLGERLTLRRAPKFTFSGGVNYRKALSNNFEGIVDVNYSWRDEFSTSTFIDPTGLDRTTLPSQDSLDLSVGISTTRSEGPNFSITGFINDALDSRTGIASAPLEVGVFNFSPTQVTKTYGIELGVDF